MLRLDWLAGKARLFNPTGGQLHEDPRGSHSLKQLAPIYLGCDSPNAPSDLIPAHTKAHLPAAEGGSSDFTTSPDSAHGSEATSQDTAGRWLGGGIPSNRVTGYVNPMFSNQGAKDLPFEENPIFEL